MSTPPDWLVDPDVEGAADAPRPADPEEPGPDSPEPDEAEDS